MHLSLISFETSFFNVFFCCLVFIIFASLNCAKCIFQSSPFKLNFYLVLLLSRISVPQIIGYKNLKNGYSILGCFGLFWAVGAAGKKPPNCHKYATFSGGFLMFSRSKNIFSLNYPKVRTEKYIIETQEKYKKI